MGLELNPARQVGPCGSRETLALITRWPSPSGPSASLLSTQTSSNLTGRGAAGESVRLDGNEMPLGPSTSSGQALISRQTGASSGSDQRDRPQDVGTVGDAGEVSLTVEEVAVSVGLGGDAD